MKNMEKAVGLFHNNLNAKFVIKVDCDADGYTSAALMTAIIKHLNSDADIKYIYSFNKEHGLSYKAIKDLPKSEVGMIIIPDASMECKDAIEISRNYKVPILVLDHHLVEQNYLDTFTGKWISKSEVDDIIKDNPDRVKTDCYTNYCIAVNDTDGQYPNDTLSGVGVVRKFGEAYCKTYGLDTDWLDEYLDLVSLGCVADSMDLRNLETRWYVLEGLKQYNQKNVFFNELQDRLSNEIKPFRTITNTGWVLGPRINGVVRYGTEKEQIDLFRAMIGEQEVVEYQPRRKSKNDPKPDVEYHTLQWNMARVADNVKSRQDTQVRSFMEKIVSKIDEQKLDKNSILFVDCSDIVDKKTVTGLCANKLATKYMRPVVLMRSKNDTEFGGSCRGYDKGPIKDLKSFLDSVGCACFGHSNAARISFKKANLDDIIAKCNELLPPESLTTIHEVSWQIPANKMKTQYVKEVAENFAVWGNTVPEPTFVITDLHINASQITGYGETKSFIRFQNNGVTYIKKYCSSGEYDKMTMHDRKTFGTNKKNLVMNIIGQFHMEEWEGKQYPEVKILFYDVAEEKDYISDVDDEDVSDSVNTLKSANTSTASTASKDDDWDWLEDGLNKISNKSSKTTITVSKNQKSTVDEDDWDWIEHPEKYKKSIKDLDDDDFEF